MRSTFLSMMVLVGGGVRAQTPPGFSPSSNEALGVRFGDSIVANGTSIPPTDAVMSPALNFNVPASNGTHIVMMVDLDAGNATHPHAYSPLLHWSKAIPSGSSSLSGNGSTMSDFAFYFGPAPPPGSGPHRYVVLLFSNSNNTFEIPPSFKDFNSSNISERFGFDVETFMTEGKLEVQAANWFTSENTTVPVATNGAGRSVSLEMTSATLFSAFIFGLLLI